MPALFLGVESEWTPPRYRFKVFNRDTEPVMPISQTYRIPLPEAPPQHGNPPNISPLNNTNQDDSGGETDDEVEGGRRRRRRKRRNKTKSKKHKKRTKKYYE